jgi:DNA invertase Pin-like site-specific DNA recombinase
MILGYARVSTQDQNLERQIDQLQQLSCERIFQEKITGTKKERPQLDMLFDQLRTGDIIVVTELTRLSRSIKDLFALVDTIHLKGANLKSLKEPWLDTTTPQGKLLFAIFAGVSQFERDLISERTREAISSARARGRKGGRPPKPPKNVELALKMHKDNN